MDGWRNLITEPQGSLAGAIALVYGGILGGRDGWLISGMGCALADLAQAAGVPMQSLGPAHFESVQKPQQDFVEAALLESWISRSMASPLGAVRLDGGRRGYGQNGRLIVTISLHVSLDERRGQPSLPNTAMAAHAIHDIFEKLRAAVEETGGMSLIFTEEQARMRTPIGSVDARSIGESVSRQLFAMAERRALTEPRGEAARLSPSTSAPRL